MPGRRLAAQPLGALVPQQHPAATNATVDFWPDISELDPDELFATEHDAARRQPGESLFRLTTQKTVVRHFQWMKDNHLDGVFLQRFSSELVQPGPFRLPQPGGRQRARRRRNLRPGLRDHVRHLRPDAATLVSTLTNDWAYLVNTLQRHQQPALPAAQGQAGGGHLGLRLHRPARHARRRADRDQLFKAAGCTVMGGVPTYWRTLTAIPRPTPPGRPLTAPSTSSAPGRWAATAT